MSATAVPVAVTIDPAVSRAIALLRLPLVLAVLLLHTLPLIEQTVLPHLLRQLLNACCRLAVPLFCFCSGYLLFNQWQSARYQSHRQKFELLRQRLFRFGIPLLSWGLLVYAAYQLLFALGFSQLVNDPASVTATDLPALLVLLFGIERNPLVYPLWFIRDLLILSLFAPVIYLLWHYLRGWLAGLLVLVFLSQCWPWFQPAAVSTVFFGLGAVAALQRWTLQLSRCGQLTCLLLSLLALAGFLQAISPVHTLALFILSASLLLWNCVLQWPAKAAPLGQSDSIFFVFAAHEPLLTLLGKLWQRLGLPVMFDVLLLLLPLALLFLLAAVYRSVIRPNSWLHLLAVGRSCRS